MKEKTLKIAAFMLCLVMLLSLFACGNKKQGKNDNEETFETLETDSSGVVEKYEEITLIEIPIEE